jgi:hypothetical protein
VTLLLDLEGVPACQCDDALEHLFKALAQDPKGEPESIWAPVENLAICRLVEQVTSQLQIALTHIQDAIARLLTGEPMTELRKAQGPWFRWSGAEFEAARMALELKKPADYTLDDWLLVVDYLLQRYLPDGVIDTVADYLTVRSSVAGKVQANVASAGKANIKIEDLVELVPTSFAKVPDRILTPVERATLQVSRARAAENISGVTASARHRMKTIVIEHVQAQVLGQTGGQYTALRQRLFDEFGALNRDFRRIAVTEAGECCNQGFIAAQPVGRKVRRIEAYRGACDFCKSINGKIFTVVAADAPEKDGQTQVWVGKTNIGRSAAPRRRLDGGLVPRSETEMWWPAAGLQHPHCRGSWVAIAEKPPGATEEFSVWLDELIRTKSPRRPRS